MDEKTVAEIDEIRESIEEVWSVQRNINRKVLSALNAITVCINGNLGRVEHDDLSKDLSELRRLIG